VATCGAHVRRRGDDGRSPAAGAGDDNGSRIVALGARAGRL